MENKKQNTKKILTVHKRVAGKIRIESALRVRNLNDLSLYYTPGVGAVSSYLAKHKGKTSDYTIRKRVIAVISDGSAVLGLGNIGPEGALPVIEGKALLFKEFAGVEAFPIVLATQDPEEIVRTIKNIAPVFAGINLEDIAAPRCFEIERRLIDELKIPVMHDDQHGTAIVVLAGLINSFRIVKKDIRKSIVVIVGAGAAGSGITELLNTYGAGDVILVDRKGILYRERGDEDRHKRYLADITNKKNRKGTLGDALRDADAVIGVSGAGMLNALHVKSMAPNSIVFAMANPVPEIYPDVAKKAGAAVVATGRSDFPNQINNVLVFPGIFKGAIECGVRKITTKMKLDAAVALAKLVKRPTAEKIIPSVFDKGVVRAISNAIKKK
ncbi:MAG: Malate dehydrogenase (Oxaloacetate-decarboxylating) [Candidatus Jorgensenbacteria bacterium GW2011_GWA2_45_13]|uniref:Malate dehydrogenase (Oxaloacetate-decarboxylating) n=1 Tax=Candidatus Jorgensenbacteria bacterium GW2011_GWA2_45_13 TaxID=1618662 RepID=A0A0G1L9B5_9BACT|nr:MAG: Malate dehydrogenase (Oxaloacetate-decarboxylating) [Candidatus Jorgensenbacteria bacterium GW2011_GWA2_45_13]